MEKVVIFLKDANVCYLAAAQGDQRWAPSLARQSSVSLYMNPE